MADVRPPPLGSPLALVVGVVQSIMITVEEANCSVSSCCNYRSCGSWFRMVDRVERKNLSAMLLFEVQFSKRTIVLFVDLFSCRLKNLGDLNVNICTCDYM